AGDGDGQGRGAGQACFVGDSEWHFQRRCLTGAQVLISRVAGVECPFARSIDAETCWFVGIFDGVRQHVVIVDVRGLKLPRGRRVFNTRASACSSDRCIVHWRDVDVDRCAVGQAGAACRQRTGVAQVVDRNRQASGAGGVVRVLNRRELRAFQCRVDFFQRAGQRHGAVVQGTAVAVGQYQRTARDFDVDAQLTAASIGVGHGDGVAVGRRERQHGVFRDALSVGRRVDDRCVVNRDDFDHGLRRRGVNDAVVDGYVDDPGEHLLAIDQGRSDGDLRVGAGEVQAVAVLWVGEGERGAFERRAVRVGDGHVRHDFQRGAVFGERRGAGAAAGR
nr:hypothetical protein [Tanacetum cinerariifolium]